MIEISSFLYYIIQFAIVLGSVYFVIKKLITFALNEYKKIILDSSDVDNLTGK